MIYTIRSLELRGSIKGGNSANYQQIFKVPPEMKIYKQGYCKGITGNYKQCTMIIYGSTNGSGTVVCGDGVESSWLCFDGMTITN